MDSDGYPTDEELEIIKTWKISDGYDKLMEYLKKQWRWSDYIQSNGNITTISTGGWSGHEEIMQALQDNYVFWGICWLSSKRGGHYTFKIKKGLL